MVLARGITLAGSSSGNDHQAIVYMNVDMEELCRHIQALEGNIVNLQR